MSLAFLLLTPLAGAALVVGLRRRRALVGTVAVGAVVVTLALAAWSVFCGVPSLTWRWGAGLSLGLDLEGFGRVMAILVPAIAAPVVGYAAAGEGEEAGPRLLAWLLGFVAAMELLVLATDFLTLLIGWELVGACSWALIGYQWRDPERPRAAAQAFLTTRFGDLGLYLAAAAAFAATGSLEFSALGAAHGPYLQVVAAGVLVAAAAKSGQVPFAPWLFSAMAGPTPASALLHSATMVAAGAYALIRLWPWLEPVGWLGPTVVGVGLVTTLAGGIVATLHSDLKKVLAGSTSSQYGLMFLAVGAGSTAAAGVQLVTHAVFKSLLFLGAGVAIHSAGSGRLDRLQLGTALPWTARLVAVGVLALAAVPPLGGAYSKEAILAVASGAAPWLGVGVLLSGALTAFYAGRLLLLAYGPGPGQSERPPRRGEIVGLGVLAALSLLLGLLWIPGVAPLLEHATSGVLVEGSAWEFVASLAIVGVAAAVGLMLWRGGRLFSLGLPSVARDTIADWLGLPSVGRALVGRPVLRLSAWLARFDDRVVDAGIRATAAVARFGSRGLSRWGEQLADGVVEGLARLTVQGATASSLLDDRGIDGAVEMTARGVGVAGTASRRLQTGLAHQYYVVMAVGVLLMVGAMLLWR